MHLSDPVNSVLSHKGTNLWSVNPNTSVYDAIVMMAEKQIGALPVMENGLLAGIVSERDYARKVIILGRSSKDTRVAEIMTAPPVTAAPEDTVTHCMHIMTELRVRHLPVVKDGRVLGIVSIGDLVNWIINRHEETIQQLHEYISGAYPA